MNLQELHILTGKILEEKSELSDIPLIIGGLEEFHLSELQVFYLEDDVGSSYHEFATPVISLWSGATKHWVEDLNEQEEVIPCANTLYYQEGSLLQCKNQ